MDICFERNDTTSQRGNLRSWRCGRFPFPQLLAWWNMPSGLSFSGMRLSCEIEAWRSSSRDVTTSHSATHFVITTTMGSTCPRTSEEQLFEKGRKLLGSSTLKQSVLSTILKCYGDGLHQLASKILPVMDGLEESLLTPLTFSQEIFSLWRMSHTPWDKIMAWASLA